MFTRWMLCLSVAFAVCACSKKDDSAANHTPPPPVSVPDSSKDTRATSTNTGPGVPRSEADELTSNKGTAISNDPEQEKQKKQVTNSIQGSEKRGHSVMRRRWDEFQAMVDRCDTEISSAREECLSKARHTYRAAKFKCDALLREQRTSCLQFGERWKNAIADVPTAPVKHAEEPAVVSNDPGDPRPAERNRDSTKQH